MYDTAPICLVLTRCPEHVQDLPDAGLDGKCMYFGNMGAAARPYCLYVITYLCGAQVSMTQMGNISAVNTQLLVHKTCMFVVEMLMVHVHLNIIGRGLPTTPRTCSGSDLCPTRCDL